MYINPYLSRVTRKPVIGVSDQARQKPGCKANEDGQRLEILDLDTSTVDPEIFALPSFREFSFPNYSRFLEFASDYLNNLNSYLKLGVFNIS